MTESVTPREWRVVLVEDDAPLAGLLVRYLKRQNMAATWFRRPGEALEALRANGADLLITDLTLGHEKGADLARSALELDPSLAVLLMSGYPYEPHEFPEGIRLVFLQKPFLPHMLKEAIEKLLEGQDGGVSASAASSLSAKLSPDSDQS